MYLDDSPCFDMRCYIHNSVMSFSSSDCIWHVFHCRTKLLYRAEAYTSFDKKLLYKKLVHNVLPNYNRNTIGYCSHNNREQEEIKKLSVLRIDLSLIKNVCKCSSCGVLSFSKDRKSEMTFFSLCIKCKIHAEI